MKKNWKKTLAALMAFAALWALAACSAGNANAPATRMPADLRDEYGDDLDEDDDEYWYDDDYGYNDDYDDEDAGAEIDQYEFEFDGHSVLVEVAVGDGWSSDVDEDVVLLYDPETSLESEGIASGVLLTEDEYEGSGSVATTLDTSAIAAKSDLALPETVKALTRFWWRTAFTTWLSRTSRRNSARLPPALTCCW